MVGFTKVLKTAGNYDNPCMIQRIAYLLWMCKLFLIIFAIMNHRACPDKKFTPRDGFLRGVARMSFDSGKGEATTRELYIFLRIRYVKK